MNESTVDNGTRQLLLTPLFKPELIELNLQSTTRDSVLAELTSKIPQLAGHPDSQATLLKALQEREQLCSTGIGDGIALPHCRNALVGLVNDPVIVFGRHDKGIAFGAVDNSPAQLFFLLVAPTVSLHLQLLARLSRVLRDSRVRKSLLVADRPEKVRQIIRTAEEQF